MISIPITKILFLDIETVGIEKSYEDCVALRPLLSNQFDEYFDWFQKRFPEDDLSYRIEESEDNVKDYMFSRRAALVPEFAKIICISMAFVLDSGEVRKQSFYGNDEKKLLTECQKLLNRCGNLGFYLCGHNLKNFDIPMMAKRMIINGILPPSILPTYDTKPWEIKAIDTKEVWQYGAYSSIGSLELMCVSMDVPSSKVGEITGEKVHTSYWYYNKLEEIKDYCERDVEVLVDVIKKLKSLK